MAKDTGKSSSRSSRRGSRMRRDALRVRSGTLRRRIIGLLQSPTFGWGVSVCVLFVLVCGTIANWAREHPLVSVGQVMNDTRLVRIEFSVSDDQQTERNREQARQSTSRIYDADEPLLDTLRDELLSLPSMLSEAETVDDVDREVRDRFPLSDEGFAALKAIALDDQSAGTWTRQIDALDGILSRRPLLGADAWLRATQWGISRQIELRRGLRPVIVPRAQAINMDDREAFGAELDRMLSNAGIDEPVSLALRGRLLALDRATFTFNAEATTEAQDLASASVSDVVQKVSPGQVIFSRGDVLDQTQLDLYREELGQFGSRAGGPVIWTRRASVFGAVAILTGILAGYVAVFCPRIARSTSRIGWLAALVAGALLIGTFAAVTEPRFLVLAAITPTVLVAILVAIAYDQRTGAAVSLILGILTCVALGQPISMLALLMTGIGAAVWSVQEIRDRRSLINMSVYVAIALGVGTLLVGAIDRPVPVGDQWPAIRQTLIEAVMATLSGLMAGGIVIFILPAVERAFDITTGMTLIELRDPKMPLLREMQQRAPGTYNHSLNVASISEAAADSIGADSLLTYVGGLYHDIGKVSKPEYFVENQSGGPNKHDKLSPAMSLLVIVGHVKDGMEMAREAGLPKALHHFIESHHGTTLVEYFYKRARKQAKTMSPDGHEQPSQEQPESEYEDERLPDEVDYRYPGPKPRTKEVAILMLADAVESATRTLVEPTPSRIDSLVRELANKRLVDGQFDECDLTLRELATIVDSISKSVASIYHGRIAYSPDKDEKESDAVEKSA